MSVRQILGLKRASIQTRIDAIGAQEAALAQKLTQFQSQGDGLGLGSVDAGFQIAAMAARSARTGIAKLEADRKRLQSQRLTLAREKLALDIADQKLQIEERKLARLEASRAADRV